MASKPPVDPQTDLFPDASPPEPNATASRPQEPGAKETPDNRTQAIETLLRCCSPVRAGSHAAAWLKSRRIFKKTWESQRLRVVDEYRNASFTLSGAFPMDRLQAWGLFNKEGHLRFYRHSLLLPWLDGGHAVWLQARAPDPEVKPAELSLTGPIPCPYNARLLDGAPGRLYLCSGALDTLELIEAGFPAVGVPEGTGLKPAWVTRFRGKSVYVAFDGDADGEAAATKAIALLTGAEVEAHRLEIPAGKDVGEWVAGR